MARNRMPEVNVSIDREKRDTYHRALFSDEGEIRSDDHLDDEDEPSSAQRGLPIIRTFQRWIESWRTKRAAQAVQETGKPKTELSYEAPQLSEAIHGELRALERLVNINTRKQSELESMTRGKLEDAIQDLLMNLTQELRLNVGEFRPGKGVSLERQQGSSWQTKQIGNDIWSAVAVLAEALEISRAGDDVSENRAYPSSNLVVAAQGFLRRLQRDGYYTLSPRSVFSD